MERNIERSLAHGAGLPAGDENAPISVIKPVYGADQFTEPNFRSWVEQRYSGHVEVIFSFQRGDDPALSIARSLVGSTRTAIAVNPIAPGYSEKMSNLHHGLEVAEHDFLVFSDSDIRARPELLGQLAAMRAQGYDLTSCLMRHLHAKNVWSRIYAAFWNFEQMVFIVPAIFTRGRDATGGTTAMTRDTLGRIIGLQAIRDYVAEDVALGRKAHELGRRVGLSPIVDSPVRLISLPSLLNKFARCPF